MGTAVLTNPLTVTLLILVAVLFAVLVVELLIAALSRRRARPSPVPRASGPCRACDDGEHRACTGCACWCSTGATSQPKPTLIPWQHLPERFTDDDERADERARTEAEREALGEVARSRGYVEVKPGLWLHPSDVPDERYATPGDMAGPW